MRIVNDAAQALMRLMRAEDSFVAAPDLCARRGQTRRSAPTPIREPL
ncbi:MAG TPA: hypothetical protein VIM99_15955 [Blastocatellia bacterium]